MNRIGHLQLINYKSVDDHTYTRLQLVVNDQEYSLGAMKQDVNLSVTLSDFGSRFVTWTFDINTL